MASTFDELTQEKAKALLTVPAGYAENRALYDGDHWKGATFWIGPRPDPTDVGASDTLAKIEKALISKNAVAEVTGRHVSALLHREPQWAFTVERPLGQIEQARDDGTIELIDEEPTEAEQALIADAEALLTTWWDERGALSVLQDAAATLLLCSRAPLRLYVPSGLLVNGSVPPGDLAQSIGLIYPDPAPSPEVATVADDPRTRQPVGVYLYIEDKIEKAEITYRDGDITILRTLGEDASAAFRFDFGGRLPMYELKRPQLITPQVRQQQMLLNLALTMLGRNVVLGGFLERILLNAQLPGAMVKQADGSTRFIPDPLQVGAGTTNVLAGLPITDRQTGDVTGYTTPSVVYRDPVPPDTFIATKLDAYRGLLEEVQQLHALISGDATASGESRKQARADFLSSLADTNTQIERAGRWLLETALAMASAFSGQPGRFQSLRAVFTCQIDAGPISADDMDATRANVLAGLLSEESGMAAIGVADVDAEQAKIAAERDAKAARAPQVAAPPLPGAPAPPEALSGKE